MPASILSVVFASSSGGSVTVPSGVQGVVAFASHWSSTNTSTLASISLGGAGSFTIAQNVNDAIIGQAVAHAETTTTGSQTLSFAFNATPASGGGPLVALMFVDGITAGDWIRATDADSAVSGSFSSSVSSATTDLVVAFHQRYTLTPSAPSGWTSQGTSSNNDQLARVSKAGSPGSSTTTFSSTDTGSVNYDTIGLVSIKEASATTVVLNPKPRNFRPHMAQ